MRARYWGAAAALMLLGCSVIIRNSHPDAPVVLTTASLPCSAAPSRVAQQARPTSGGTGGVRSQGRAQLRLSDQEQKEFFELVAGGDMKRVRAALKRNRNLADCRGGPAGHTPLMAAVVNGDKDMVRLLLRNGADVDRSQGTRDFMTPLKQAIAIGRTPGETGDIDMARLLLSMGADADHRGGKGGETPMETAARGGQRQMIDLLLSYGADPDAGCPSGSGAIRAALDTVYDREASIGLARYLVSRGAHEDLIAAAALDDVDQLKKLIASGADTSRPGGVWNEMTPICWAAFYGSSKAVEYLMSVCSREVLNTPDEVGLTPLHYVVWNGDTALARRMIAGGAMVDPYIASGLGDLARVRTLIGRGSKADTAGPNERTSLDWAARGGHIDVLKFLLAGGIGDGLVERKREGALSVTPAMSTALCYAAERGHLDTVRYLLSSGVDINGYSINEETALLCAAANGHSATCELLLSRGADVDCAGGHELYWTPLQAAASGGHLSLVKLLLSKGAKIDHRDHRGETALFDAAVRGHAATAELLMSRGARVDARNDEGATPLHAAARNGHRELVSLLVSRGAEVNAVDALGQTPLRLAITGGHSDTAGFLRRCGAIVRKPKPRKSYWDALF